MPSEPATGWSPALGPAAQAPPAWVPSAGTPDTGAVPMLYAGFWLRVVAAIIDGLIIGFAIGIPFAFLMAAAGLSSTFQGIHPGESLSAIFATLGVGFIVAFFATFLVAGWLYFALLESSAWQGTLGKKALGLYVTDRRGGKVTFARASGRYFGGRFLWHVPAFGILYGCVDCIMAGLSGHKQAIHDMIADCLVLRKV